MGQWVVTVAGIAVLSVLCDIVLPDGQTRKYVKTVIGVVVTLVMIQPLAGLVGGSLNVGGYSEDKQADVVIQQQYLDMTLDKQVNARLTTACDVLNANGLTVKAVSVDRHNKQINMRCFAERSEKNEKLLYKVFNTYFAEYKIVVDWEESNGKNQKNI